MVATEERPPAKPCPLRAANNYCVVRLQEARDVMVGSLLIPSLNGKAVVHGVVESVGPDVEESIHQGDIALVPPYGVGIPVQFRRVKYLMILDYDILGVWRHESFPDA